MNEKTLIFHKIKGYFEKDYSYKMIIHLLNEKHNISISHRSLLRLLQEIGLKRKNINERPREEIVTAIILELENSGNNLGYRSMWKRLRKVYKLSVKPKTVMKILKVVDPEGVEIRTKYRMKRRVYSVAGPNFLWHADGYDKLKRYGFAIYGCIDGFSKMVFNYNWIVYIERIISFILVWPLLLFTCLYVLKNIHIIILNCQH